MSYDFTYYAYFAYCNMQNMQNMNVSLLFCILFCISCILICILSHINLHILHILHITICRICRIWTCHYYFAYYFAYCCIYMQNNMQNMQNNMQAPKPICRIVTRSYFAYSAYIWTPHFADAASVGWGIPVAGSGGRGPHVQRAVCEGRRRVLHVGADCADEPGAQRAGCAAGCVCGSDGWKAKFITEL